MSAKKTKTEAYYRLCLQNMPESFLLSVFELLGAAYCFGGCVELGHNRVSFVFNGLYCDPKVREYGVIPAVCKYWNHLTQNFLLDEMLCCGCCGWVHGFAGNVKEELHMFPEVFINVKRFFEIANFSPISTRNENPLLKALITTVKDLYAKHGDDMMCSKSYKLSLNDIRHHQPLPMGHLICFDQKEYWFGVIHKDFDALLVMCRAIEATVNADDHSLQLAMGFAEMQELIIDLTPVFRPEDFEE